MTTHTNSIHAVPQDDATTPRFWRDAALSFVEARSVRDGRKVCYTRHTHDTFSIGAVTGGHSTYLNGSKGTSLQPIGAGAVVVVNPEELHACNPVADEAWSYCMIYVDVQWLTNLQRELGFSQNLGYRGFATTWTTAPHLYAGLNGLYATLTDPHGDLLHKHGVVIDFFTDLHRALNPAPSRADEGNLKLARAADYIREHCTRALRLDEICAAADLSPSYLIRAFKQHYGMTPHAWLVNRRVDYSRAQLKRGRAIADVAIDAGFADQAHLQRAFRQYVAATPGQYRAAMRVGQEA
ncbi:AraC family transcriptional regulator [Paraburkholderia sp. SUR17]|uniref:AraC family transcriptional regulator n=1 Tax=Paraburkholderia sp. SUR17 TaxID=3034358 RepID=UPI002407F523|nr:AraC family transcriptional regulator [Paraburkholderia sp. SUR17]WEY41027.1 AraC family transcriptional regulator [Paraburkholderia sp. SUR17]